MNKSYYEMDRNEKAAVRQAIGARAYKELPGPGEHNGDLVANCGYGIPMSIVAEIQKHNRDDILLQGESCVIGMNGYLEKGDPEVDMRHIDPAGNPIKVHRKGSKQMSVADSFAFINSGKLYATFLGAFQVAANGDLANWAVSNEHKAGAGGAMALCRGAKRVFVCMIEDTKDGVSKLVKRCNIPLTGVGCVDLVFTDKGVYKPAGDHFVMLERYNQEKQQYEPVKVEVLV